MSRINVNLAQEQMNYQYLKINSTNQIKTKNRFHCLIIVL